MQQRTKIPNMVNNFIFFGRGREFSSNRIFNQEVLSNKNLFNKMTPEDFRGLNPLFYNYINPYGSFNLNMDNRFDFEIKKIA